MATIESYGDDQGGGASFCSGCQYNLTSYLFSVRDHKETLICPHCKQEIVYGGIYPYSFEGSDF